MYTDRVLTCADCGNEFTFTASEQEFYADRNFSEPRRCASCRASRKAARGDTGGGGRGGYSSGGGYDSGYSSGAGYNSGGGSSYGSGSAGYGTRPQREMFEATCSNCGKPARVPFRPTSGKPVYCSDCFTRR